MNQQIYPPEEHKISLEAVDSDALAVMERLREAGFMAYLVGGGVRDLLLGHTPKDFDISTSAKPEEIKRLFRNCILIGRRFRLAHIRFGRKILEVSTFRSGDNESDTLIVRDNEWGSSEEDVKRRDFTINGLFYDPATETVIDYVGGYQDIQKRNLRTIGQPFLRFKQDPVRMIRLLKFRARFGLTIEEETKAALLECRQEITKSSQARILEELFRMLESGAAEPFFRLLAEHGILPLLLPSLAHFLETPEGNTLFSFLHEIDTMCRTPEKEALDRAVLLSCLIFPFLDQCVHLRFTSRNKIPHLGEIHHEACGAIDEIFHPFFLIPRRIRGISVSILTSQYRLTPLGKRRPGRMRIPRDPDFALALTFLQVRSCVEPELKQLFEEWHSHFQALYPSTETPAEEPSEFVRSKRRRKRRRGSSPEGQV